MRYLEERPGRHATVDELALGLRRSERSIIRVIGQASDRTDIGRPFRTLSLEGPVVRIADTTAGRTLREVGLFAYSTEEVQERLDLIQRALDDARTDTNDRDTLQRAKAKLAEWERHLRSRP